MTTKRALEVGKINRNLFGNCLPMGPSIALAHGAYDDQN
jgi:hypothetical protein